MAPQNTFLENIVRRSSGKRCIRISVTQAFHRVLYSGASGRGAPAEAAAPGAPPRAAVRGCLPEAGKGGPGGAGADGSPSHEDSPPGDAFWPFWRPLGLISGERDSG